MIVETRRFPWGTAAPSPRRGPGPVSSRRKASATTRSCAAPRSSAGPSRFSFPPCPPPPARKPRPSKPPDLTRRAQRLSCHPEERNVSCHPEERSDEGSAPVLRAREYPSLLSEPALSRKAPLKREEQILRFAQDDRDMERRDDRTYLSTRLSGSCDSGQ